MNVRHLLALVALLGGIALSIPGAALAKQEPVYKLSLKGSQVTTWSQSHMPQFACDATVVGNGSQTLSYRQFDPSRLQLVRPKGMPAMLASPSDPLAEYGAPQELAASAIVEREGVQDIQSVDSAECGGTGGGGVGAGPDCGERRGLLRFRLGFGVDPLEPQGART